MTAPIAVFAYNRAEHVKMTLEALAKNDLAVDSDLFIFCDGAKNGASPEAIAKVEKTREVIDAFAKEHKDAFKSIDVVKKEANAGLAASIIAGATELLEKFGRIIVLEDDLITAKDFLSYMNEALDYYEKNEKVWSISGYTFPLKSFEKYPHDVYASPRGCSWGWGTWKDRFMKVDWKVSDYQEFIKDAKAVKHFNEGGVDMANMLASQMAGKINSWAIRWCYAESRNHMFTIYPKESRIRNAGVDGSGTHCVDSGLYDTTLVSEGKKVTFENVEPDSRIMGEFRLMYDYSHLGGLRRKIHRMFL